jgi:phage shock protein PspC (stress-responsive transcriptional regulator)
MAGPIDPFDRAEPTPPTSRRRLRRSRDERVLFGVCGGLGDYFGVDATLVRIGFVVAALVPPLTALSLLGYFGLAVLLPEEGIEHLAGRERIQRNLEGLRADVDGLTETVRGGLGRRRDGPPAPPTGMRQDEATDATIDHAAAGRYHR